MSPMIEKPVTDFPDPDSPTRPSVSPRGIDSDTALTACTARVSTALPNAAAMRSPMLSFGAILLLWVLDFGSQAGSSAWASGLEYLSVFRHYDDFTRGVIDTSNVIFYLSFIFLGVFLTVRSVDSMRWRRA